MKNSRQAPAIEISQADVLTEVSIDNFNFQVTRNPFESGSCIVWFRDVQTQLSFNALGKFSSFDKRKALDFMARYSTSPALREEIEHRKFESRMRTLSLSFLHQIEAMDRKGRERAYKEVFDLDEASEPIDSSTLSRRRKAMTRRFHPDAGGDHKAMTLINEAYDYLSKKSQAG